MVGVIRRDPGAAAATSHDLVVIGGGIHGVMATLEAARRGYRTLLLERDDFGGATSWNHLRILHGGLRYLQSADIRRFGQSVSERRWLASTFPELVRPLPCLMPLYGTGVRRPWVLRAALALNDLLSWYRNRGVPASVRVPPGTLLSPDEVASRFPAVRPEGLAGGALWYDVSLEWPQRLVIEALRWACAAGAHCLNYVEATGLYTEADGARVGGVEAMDRHAGEPLRFRTSRVLNCAGPWSRSLARAFHTDIPALFRPSIAFNVLLDRPPPAAEAVAIEPGGGGRTYFLRPWRGRTLAGTFHAPREGGRDPEDPTPRPEEVEAFVGDLQEAAPRLEVTRSQVVRVYGGLLPCAEQGSAELTNREVIVDHGSAGGPQGLVSVSGIKLTTARAVAERALERAFGPGLAPYRPEPARPEPRPVERASEFLRAADASPDEAAERLRRWAREEAALTADDLLWRRGDWSEEPDFELLRERVPAMLRPEPQRT